MFNHAPQPTILKLIVYAPYGDSITDGSNASPMATMRWSTLAKTAIWSSGRMPVEYNESISGGDVITDLQPLFEERVLVHNPELVILAGGLNDMRLGTSVETFTVAYNAMVAAAVAHASVRYVICCSLPHITAYGSYEPYNQGSDALNHTYNAAIAAIATANGAAFADVHTGMAHNDALVDVDGIHPNNAGHANIAVTVAAAIAATL